MRAVTALLALLLTAPATAEPDASGGIDADPVLAWVEAFLPTSEGCLPPSGPPSVQCLREQMHEVCRRLRDCRAVCDSFVPGFDTIELPRYDARREIVYGSMLVVEPAAGHTLFGIIRYEIHVSTSFNVEC